MTSEYLSIGHTTILHTPCIHTELSVVVSIVPLPDSPNNHSSYVQGSPHTRCPQISLQYLVRLFSGMSALRYAPDTSKMATSLNFCALIMRLLKRVSTDIVGEVAYYLGM